MNRRNEAKSSTTSTLTPTLPRCRHVSCPTVLEDPVRGRSVQLAGQQNERNGSRSKSLDRKSTRLNSSHRTISYAVFCLKKKKNPRLIHFACRKPSSLPAIL